MQFKALAAVVAMAAGGPAMAACTESFNLGVMGPPALRLFGNDFGSAQHFEDCYAFTLSGPANSFGFSLEFDGSVRRNITVGGLTLTGGDLAHPYVDTTASSFSFPTLKAGTYQFVITGDVTGRDGGFLGGGLVGYGGTFVTTTAAAPVPEPATYAMMAAGLLALGIAMRRRNPGRLTPAEADGFR